MDIETLRPPKAPRIIDLVAEAGIDITDWADTTGAASANPKYCYQWAWQQGDIVLLTIWHEELTVNDHGVIVFENNYRADWIYEKSQWPARAHSFEVALAKAYHESLPVRVMVVDERNSQKYRVLDTENWSIARFDETTGDFIVQRQGFRRYVDQFDEVLSEAVRISGVASGFERSQAVRQKVLLRACGRCEHCNEPGFLTQGNYLYLETHHIKPLYKGGLDHPSNMVALCANCHRKAHYSLEQETITRKLVEVVAARALYPTS
ncbi:HNH endonuclease [Ferrimonas balearica]|uniref:HNH endonuclease n=1 Tax=Ferrimonas balearica TaxID=44012 RepID=UPI001C59F6E1|nr:HNH endonuclease signature motif containing protein [Ferrimonas balearica]MBW3140565.1 HNH endonuclease [Ferrimonas balearica]